MLQSSYTSRRLVDRIRILRLDRYGSGDKGDGSYAIIPWRLVLHTIGSVAVQLCPDGDPKVIRLLSESFLAGVKGDSTRSSLQILDRPTTVHSRQRSHQQRLEG